MQHRPHTYLFWIQYLGLRYHGWQKQPNLKTIQGRLERVIRYVLGHENFSVLAAGRTDSGVSCEKGAFELFNIAPLVIEDFIREANISLPDDIKILSGQSVGPRFNIIQDVIGKEYRYYFSTGEKPHPFATANIFWMEGALDFELIKSAVELYKGTYDFRRFCTKGKNTENYTRTIYEAEILRSEGFGGTYYPEHIYCFRVKGSGFLMHQVRMMVEALFKIGNGEIDRKELAKALLGEEGPPLVGKAPAHGLVLHEVMFDEEKILNSVLNQ